MLKDMGLTKDQLGPAIAGAYDKTKGAGSHAEIYAVNKLLLDNPNVKISDIAIYVNRTLGPSKPVSEIPFKTCPQCKYILEGFYIISVGNCETRDARSQS